ncbi:hypothetical protein, conserved [Trypanosoma brucei gambiense DAL972]|uniref:Uncharacterized protein n=2 Tax=Trypanosoma brucei TaxID=5691 RepID=C9ZML9_TRYB9|nr:hypothetical protein, conserved [Trypanosoma brucei gambiense DAL972]RHW72991.1 hypothetical protein DPX39_040025800 [Trypanosoma brucei equiperdum]CBH10522.1 hypothetical protein, conserved [Trypanosoma brucei gambiense DAL972]|eukprot:XP_011772811.1 hypothetical protein, conserved [Trypanosoma brucei gambiense DAL972]
MLPHSVPTSPHQERDRPLEQMTDEELRRELVMLIRTNAILAEESAGLQADISALCEESVRFQQSTEIEEDKVTNQLLRRLQSEEVQKHRFHHQILCEEKARRKIMDQITQVRQQMELEKQLEQEQEVQRMELQRKLIDVVNKKIEVERQLLEERRVQLEALTTKLASIKEGSLAAKSKVDGAVGSRGTQGPSASSQQCQSGTANMTHESPAAAAAVAASSQPPPVKTETVPSSVDLPASDVAGDDTHGTIIRLEEQLNRLLEQHAAATQASATNESLCTELGRNLETIQQAASVDRARTLKLKEELQEAKRRVAVLEQRAAVGTAYAASDDSSDLPTPSVSSLYDDKRRESLLNCHQRYPSSCVPPSCSASEAGEDTRSV